MVGFARSMDTAPKNRAIVILTPHEAHKARWDPGPRFLNFWSSTAGRALSKPEARCWMELADWRAFVGGKKKRA